MATRSYILIEVNDTDYGKIIKPDVDLIHKREVDIESLETRKKIEDTEMEHYPTIKLNHKYIGIYNHWDGDLNWTGKGLFTNFKTYEEALNLMTFGACSSIISGKLRPYALRGEKYTGSDYEGPKQFNKIPKDLAQRTWAEFVYLFKNNQWYWTEAYEEKFEWKSVEESLKEQETKSNKE